MTIINGQPVSSPTQSTSIQSPTPRPARFRRRRLLTLADVVDHLLRIDEVNPGEPRAIERCILAARSALNNFLSYSTQGFKYYDGRAKVVLEASISVGAITVSNAVASPTSPVDWPSWVLQGVLRVGRHAYPVLSFADGTVTVDGALPNGSYTGAILEHVFVRLPQDFRRRGSIVDTKEQYPVEDVSSGILQSWSDYFDWASSSSQRVFAALSINQNFQGELMMAVWPSFTVRKEMSMFYERYPQPIETHRQGAGTISITGTTATASGFSFTEDHVGSAIVIATGNEADIRKSLSSTSLVQAQRVIVARESATVATIDAPLSSSLSETFASRTFYISDILDVMPGSMAEAFLRMAEYELARQSTNKTAPRRMEEFMDSIRLAMADDCRYKSSSDDNPYRSAFSGYGLGDVDTRP
jgi:hypothetical protein